MSVSGNICQQIVFMRHIIVRICFETCFINRNPSQYRISVAAVLNRDGHNRVLCQSDRTLSHAAGIMIDRQFAEQFFLAAVYGVIYIHVSAAPKIISAQHNDMFACRKSEIIGNGIAFFCPVSIGIQRS